MFHAKCRTNVCEKSEGGEDELFPFLEGSGSETSSSHAKSQSRHRSPTGTVLGERARRNLPSLTSCALLAVNAMLLIALVIPGSIKPAEVEQLQGWVRPDSIYGLIHVAKVGGTSINGELASHYERVCGNKGYSYDFLEHNKREAEKAESGQSVRDFISKLDPTHNRGNPFSGWMEEIGFDDCDYIALEKPAKYWLEKFAMMGPMELHLPCREPLNHLMSQINMFSKVPFDCEVEDLRSYVIRRVSHSFVDMRFQPIILESPNITVKCFDPMPPRAYVEYMGSILQRKRFESKYVHRDMNSKRNKESECIWNQTEEFQAQVRQILREEYFYYEFCDSCMGSADELPLDHYKSTFP